MFCNNCGKKADGGEKFCKACGKPLAPVENKEAPKAYSNKSVKANGISNKIKTAIGLVVVACIIWGYYSSSKNDTAISTSNSALNIANTSDTADATEQTIQGFKTALAQATDNDTKRTILTNLALTYDGSGDETNALSTYRQALGYASEGTAPYYLLSGEIAQLQVNPADAQSDLIQADKLNPNDYQINNELALFYLDLDDKWTSYDDLPKALEYMKLAYSLEKNDTSTENLGLIYFYNDDYQQAIDTLLPLNLTNHPQAALYLGYSYAAQKDVKNAEFYFQKAIDLGVKVPQEVNDYLNQN